MQPSLHALLTPDVASSLIIFTSQKSFSCFPPILRFPPPCILLLKSLSRQMSVNFNNQFFGFCWQYFLLINFVFCLFIVIDYAEHGKYIPPLLLRICLPHSHKVVVFSRILLEVLKQNMFDTGQEKHELYYSNSSSLTEDTNDITYQPTLATNILEQAVSQLF